jgi:hypothetical protein
MAKRSKTQQNKINDEINEKARAYIADMLVPLLTEALGIHCNVEIQKNEKDLGHIVRVKYPETDRSGNLLPYIQLEIGPLASWLPHAKHTIRPYAAEEFPDQFEDPGCPVLAIDAERTFWEKATILHHEAHRPEESAVPLRYSRHYYDLYMMGQSAVMPSALARLELLNEVVEFKKRFYPRGWAQYELAKPGTLRLIPPKRIRNAMRKDYNGMQEMIFGRRPDFDEILQGLTDLENKINALQPLS